MTIINKVSSKTLMPGITAVPDVVDAPTIGTATDVGTSRAYNNGSATITFTAPVTGGTPTSYTATSSPGGLTGSGASSPVTVTGLSSATAYTFTVKGTNATATGPESSASGSVTATTVPQAPTVGTVSVTNTTTVSVPFTAGATGGSSITSYTATSSPSISLSVSGTTSPLTVTGSFAQATAYTFTISAVNANGTSSASSSSNSVTPYPMKFVAMSGLSINPNLAYSTDGITWTTAYTGKAESPDRLTKAGNYWFSYDAAVTAASLLRYSSDGITWTTAGVNSKTADSFSSKVQYAFSTYFMAGWRLATTPNYCYMYTSSTGTSSWTETLMSSITQAGQGGLVAANSAGTGISLLVVKANTYWYTTTSPTSGWTSYSPFPRTTYGPYKVMYVNDRWISAGDDGFSYSTNGTTWTASTGNQDGTANILWTGTYYVGGGSSAKIWTSSNGGANWTSNTISGITSNIQLAYGAGLVVGLQSNSYGSTNYYTSTTGTGSWTTRTFPFNSYGTEIYYA